jgi:hypothetical protein
LRARVSIDGFCYGAALIIGNSCRPSRARSWPCAGRNDLPVRWLYGSAFGPFLMSACGFSAAHAARPRIAARLSADPTRQSAGSCAAQMCKSPQRDSIRPGSARLSSLMISQSLKRETELVEGMRRRQVCQGVDYHLSDYGHIDWDRRERLVWTLSSENGTSFVKIAVARLPQFQ